MEFQDTLGCKLQKVQGEKSTHLGMLASLPAPTLQSSHSSQKCPCSSMHLSQAVSPALQKQVDTTQLVKALASSQKT